MYRLTLQDVQNERGLQKAAGCSPQSPDFLDYLNRAQRILLRRGKWFDTEWVVSFCVSGSVIAWPRWVGAVSGVRFGKGKPGQLFNNNFSFVGPHMRHSGFHCDAVIEDANLGPTANEVSGTNGKQIVYHIVKPTDIGKTITLFGTQYGGQPLQEQIAGAWQNGVTITATAVTDAMTTALVTRIDGIERQATDGMAYLYEYDPVAYPVAPNLRFLAAFEPGDTHPRIRRSIIRNKPFNCGQPDANGICWTTIEALIKLEFLPLVNARDFLMLDNIDALIYGVQSVKAVDAGNKQDAEVALTEAIRELNFELRSKNDDDQMPVRVNSVMGRRIKNPI